MQQRGQDAGAGGGDGVAQGDAGAVDVQVVLVGQFPFPQHGQHLGGKGFVEFDQVHILEGKADFVHHLFDRRHGADAHGGRVAAGYGPAAQERHGFQAEFVQLVLGHYQTDRCGIVLAAGVAGRHAAIAQHRAQAGQGLQRGVGAGAFVAVERHRVAAALRHGNRHDFRLKAGRGLGGDGALVAAEGVFVLFLAGYFVFFRQIFGGFHHAAGDRAETLIRGYGDAGAGQAVVKGDRAEAGAPAGFVAVKLGAAHAFHAAGDHRVGVFGLHQHTGVEDGLEAGGAAAVELVAGNFDGQPGL